MCRAACLHLRARWTRRRSRACERSCYPEVIACLQQKIDERHVLAAAVRLFIHISMEIVVYRAFCASRGLYAAPEYDEHAQLLDNKNL